MSKILVLVDHTDGTPKKVTLELLTKARMLGEPAAVFVGQGYANAAMITTKTPIHALGRPSMLSTLPM